MAGQGTPASIGTWHGFRVSRLQLQPEIMTMLAPAPASPETVGMSRTALNRTDAHLKQRYIDTGRFPGTQLLVYRRGKVAHSSVQGLADVERKVAMRDDTI